MKARNFIFTVFSVLILFSFVSCEGLAMPKKVQVKTDAELKVCVGEADLGKYINQYCSPEFIRSQVAGIMGDKARVYDYKPVATDDTLTYLIQYPLYEMDFDVGSMMGGFDLSSGLGGAGVSDLDLTMQVPALPGVSLSQDIDFTSILNLSSDTAKVTETLSDFPEGPFTENDSLVTADLNLQIANGIQFASGSKLKIVITRTDSNPVADDYKLYLKAAIPSKSYTSGSDNLTFNGTSSSYVTLDKDTSSVTIYLDLAKGVLPKESTVKIGGKATGSVTGTTHSYEAKVYMQDTVISKLYGVDTSKLTLPTISIPSTDIELGAVGSMLKEATIAENGGYISIVADRPTGWDAISLNLDSFSFGGVMSVSKSDFTDKGGKVINQYCDLKDKTIDTSSSSKITYSANISLVIADGANLDFSKAKKTTCNVNATITKFSSVKVGTSQFFQPISMNIPLGTEVTNLVSEIDFGSETGYEGKKKTAAGYVDCDGIGIKAKVINGLPVGSDIPLTLTSAKLGFTGSAGQRTITATGSSTAQTDLDITGNPKLTFTSAEKTSGCTIGINISIGDSNGDITLQNIEVGKNYTVAIKDISFVCDWNYVKVSDSAFSSFNMTGNFPLNFDIYEIVSPYGIELSNVEFASLPLYVFAQKPSGSEIATALGNLSISGHAKINYQTKSQKEAGSGTTACTIFDETSTVSFKEPVAWPEDTTKQINSKNNAAFINSLEEKKSLKFDIAENLLNTNPAVLTDVDYEVSVSSSGGSELQLYSYMLTAGETTKIAIEMALPVAMKFTVKEDFNMNVRKTFKETVPMLAPGNDLLGRTSIDDFYSYKKIYDDYGYCLDYVKIGYTLSNKIIPNLSAKLTLDDTTAGHIAADGSYAAPANGPTEIKKEFDIGSSSNLTFTSNDVSNVLFEKYPYDPVITFKIPANTYSISRSGLSAEDNLTIKLEFVAKLSKDRPVEIDLSTFGLGGN